MMRAAPTLLCLGAGAEQLPAIERAEALGCRVAAVDVDPDAVGLRRCSSPHVVDIADYEAVLRIAADIGIDGVLPAPVGRHVVLAGLVNDTFGLIGPSREVAERCADKRLFGELTGRGARPLDERVELDPRVPPMSPPFVLKPVRGSGGRGVGRIDDASAWAVRCGSHDSSHYPDGVLLEPFCTGEPYGVDAMVQDGRVEVVLLRGKRLDFSHGILETAYLAFFDDDTSGLERRAGEALQALVDALGYGAGLLHADLVIDATRVHVIEMSPRPSGLHLSSLLLPASTGVDFLEQGIRQVCGQPIRLTRKRETCTALQYLALGPGRVERLPEPAALAAVDDWRIGFDVGEHLDAPITMNDLLRRGHLLVSGDSPSAVKATLEKTLCLFDIRR